MLYSFFSSKTNIMRTFYARFNETRNLSYLVLERKNEKYITNQTIENDVQLIISIDCITVNYFLNISKLSCITQ